MDSGVSKAYSDSEEISPPRPGEAFYGQDASYSMHPASYTKNPDGTVSDNVTGLMWEADMGQKMTLEEAGTKASASRLGGHSDWRVPTLQGSLFADQFQWPRDGANRRYDVHRYALFRSAAR